VDSDGLLAATLQIARIRNWKSKANGSLMRCMPLGIWGHQLDDHALARLARFDSALSHPNPTCCDAVAAYTIALAELVGSGDSETAVTRAQKWTSSEACREVKDWLSSALKGSIWVPSPGGLCKVRLYPFVSTPCPTDGIRRCHEGVSSRRGRYRYQRLYSRGPPGCSGRCDVPPPGLATSRPLLRNLRGASSTRSVPPIVVARSLSSSC
jgi:hypothetical protein